MSRVQNILDIIKISPQNRKLWTIIFECNFCKEHHSTFLLWPYKIKIGKMNTCTKCNKINCTNCIVCSIEYYEKQTICNNCLPNCHVKNCMNKSVEFCMNCRRPLCSEHTRNKNIKKSVYCHQKKSLECARYSKQNKK